jgi:hypothetical protein
MNATPRMTPRRSRSLLLIGVLVLLGLTQSNGSLTNARAAKHQLERTAWRQAIRDLRVPAQGCFNAVYPQVVWKRVGCVTVPLRPAIPKHGHRPAVVGNGTDWAGRVTGAINAAEGSFPSVSGVTSENVGGNADVYSLQLNTNTFSGTPMCTGHPGCQGWQQFLYESGDQAILIQYWLINYDATCPAGWATYLPGGGHTDCYENGPMQATVLKQPITSLSSMQIDASASATGSDIVKMFYASTNASAANMGSILSLGQGTNWRDAEFAVLGDYSGRQAVFNAGSTITVKTTVHNGTRSAPTCEGESFTGETNNLNLVGTAAVGTSASPAIVSTQSNASGGTPSSCQAASGIGDTHLTTFQRLLYDYQATGDFVLVKRSPDFVVETRQVSGAPTWPNAAVNTAIGARIGSTKVAVCLPNQVDVNGHPVTINQGSPLLLPGGSDIYRTGGGYVIRGPRGDSVLVTLNPTWLDVNVGLGEKPSNVRGLLANANGNLNQLATSGGTVLTEPLSFKQLYFQYGDSWRVPLAASLLAACNGKARSGHPTRPFYAKDLPRTIAQKARTICVQAHVRKGPLLDACTLDVAVTAKARAAKAYVGMPAPAAVAITH